MNLKKYINIYIFVLIVVSFCTTSLQAQYYNYKKGYDISKGLSVAVMFGPTVFSGDLGLSFPDNSPKTKEANYIGLSYGLSFKKEILEVVSVRLQANKGTFQGQRENSNQIPYVGFNSDFYEFTLGANVNWNNIIGGYYKYRPVSFYTINTASFITFGHTTKFLTGDLKGELDNIHFNTEGREVTNAVAFLTKVGGGAKFRLDDNWGVVAEVTGNFVFSDQLDGYVYESPNRNRALYTEETPDNDFYYMAQVGIEYTFKMPGFRSKSKFNRKTYKYKYKRYKFNPGRKRLLRR